MVTKGPGPRQAFVRLWRVAGTAICFLFVGLPSAAPQTSPAKSKGTPPSGRPDIIFVQTPELVSGPLAQRFPKGSSLARLNLRETNSGPVRMTDGFFAAADPQISFEGTKVLFSAQRSEGERWQIWEMELDGSNKRQVTQCAENCLRAAYLPAGEIAFTVEEAKGKQWQSYLAVVNSDGTEFHRISFGPASFRLETVLRDGRIVASAPWPLIDANAASWSRLLYTLRPDGTALESFRCDHRKVTMQSDAEELEDGSLIYVQDIPAGSRNGGDLVQVPLGAPSGLPLSNGQAVYQSARQLSKDKLLVAKAAPGSKDSAERFDLYTFRLKTGTVGERVFADPHLSSIQAVAVAPRAVPKHYWSTLNPTSATGYFISLNSYLSAKDSGGNISTPIAKVRVLTLDSSIGREHDMGDAPVESDGSFYVRVPANSPVRFVLLDAKGHTIREERSWVWTRPGEQRGCTGCHGDKAVAPENHWPLTLRRLDTPTPLGDTEHAAATAQAK